MGDDSSELNNRLGKRICELREKLNLTQEQLSEYSSLSQNFISHLENGKKTASITTLHKLSKALGLPVSYFFDGHKKPCSDGLSELDRAIMVMVRKLSRHEKLTVISMLKGLKPKNKK